MMSCVKHLPSISRCLFWSSSRRHSLPGTSSPLTAGLSRPGLYFRCYSRATHNVGGTNQRRQLWLLIIPVTTFCLGTWQIFRLQWKLDLIEKLEKKTKAPAVSIPKDILEKLEEFEYRHVYLSGQFDHSRELHIWPRTLYTGDRTPTRGGPEPGANIVTAFYCNELGEFVLVNRGWVPKRKMDPESRQQGQIEGPVTLTAVVRSQEKRPSFSPKNDPLNNHWSYKDIMEMAKCAGTAPLFLDADSSTTVPFGPIGGQTRVTLRNEHLQYVFTWYALSLFTGYMFYQLWTKRKRSR